MANAGTQDVKDVALRCRALVVIYAEGNSRAFASSLGMSPTRWNNIERSGALSKDVAFTIIKLHPEVSLDWLWRGRDDGMPRAKGEEFLAAYKKVVSSLTPKTGKRRAAS